MKKLLTVLALVAALGSFSGIVLKFNSSFAKTEAVEYLTAKIDAVNDRITIMKLEDSLVTINKKMWAIEDRWTAKFVAEKDRNPESISELKLFMPKEYRDDYRDLELKKSDVENKIKKLKED